MQPAAQRRFPTPSAALAARYGALRPGRLLDGYVDDAADADPGRLAVVDGPERVTYADLADRVGRVSAGLRRLGVGPGDVVALQLPNWWEALVVHLATIRLGAVAHPLMPILRARELRFVLASGGARVLVVPERFRGFDHAGLALALAAELPGLEHVVTVRGAAGGGARDGAVALGDLLAEPEPAAAAPGRSPSDPVVLLYTSGTESDPKGAVHSHDTLAHEDRSMIGHFGLTADDVVFMPSPVAHVTGVLYGFHLATMLATTVVYLDVWEPGEGLALLAAERCSFCVAATPFLHGLTYHPRRTEYDLSALRAFACGGADVPPGLIRDAQERLGALAVRVYGSTEIPTITAGHASDPAELRAATDGRPVGTNELRVVDEDGADLPPGTEGLLLARGPEAFLGYLDAARPAFDDEGWFATGDLGRVDADGFLTVTGRSKDIILRGGENISAKEVEDLLYGHPDVADVAVVAVPDPVLTERACAVLVTRPGRTVDLASLSSFLDTHDVARQKYPERLEIVDELPRTPTGKVQKFRLRARLADGGDLSGGTA